MPPYISATPYRVAPADGNVRTMSAMSQIAKFACLKYFCLVVILVGYALLGAMVFCALESPTEDAQMRVELKKLSLQLHRDYLMLQLCNSTNSSMISTKNDSDCYSTAADILATYEDLIKNATEKTKPKWNFAEAIVFCGTIFTTIGYGHLAPKTDWGRIFTMFYAMIGIPLMFAILASIGQLLCRLIHRFWSRIRAKMCGYSLIRNKLLEDIAVEHYDFPVSIALGITLAWVLACTMQFWYFEPDWSFITAFYFCFISLSTIGLGDVTPVRSETLVINFISIVLGLALVSMCVNLVQYKLEILIQTVKEQIHQKLSAGLIDKIDDLANDADGEIHKLIKAEANGTWLLALMSRQNKNRLIEEYKRQAKLRVKEVQTYMEAVETATQCQLETKEFGSQTDVETVELVVEKRLPKLPFKETKPLNPAKNTDDMKLLFREIDYLLTDCQGLLHPNLPK